MGAEVKENDGFFEGAKNVKIHYHSWVVPEAKGVVVLVHGLAEHIGRYKGVVEFLTKNGYSVYMLEHRGHGKSEGIRGHVDHFDQYIEDLDKFINDIVKKETNADKVILIGHSLGGLITLRYSIMHPDNVRTAVVSAPALRIYKTPSKLKVGFAKLLSKVAPSTKISSGIDPNLLTHDKKVVEEYIKDPLVFRKITARFGLELINTGADTLSRAGEFKVPLLAIVGTEDKIVDPKAVEEFYNNVPVADKELKKYEGLYHELFNETKKDKVLNDVLAWISKH